MKKPTPEKAHGNTGKKHALKGDTPLDARISFRIAQETKEAAEEAAEEAGLSASRWYCAAIERALQ